MKLTLALFAVAMVACVAADGAESYPYGKGSSMGGMKMGEQTALAVPPFLLYLVMICFIAGIAFVVMKIFKLQSDKENKKTDKEAKRQAKAAKKLSSKKST